MIESKSENKFQKYFPLIAIGFALLLYSSSLSNKFTLTDYPAFKENKFLNEGLHNLADIFSSSFYEGSTTINNDPIYRPISSVFYGLQISLFGPDSPGAMHGISLILYAAIAFLIYGLLNRWTHLSLLSLLGTLIFIAHPIHSEIVLNIKSQDSLLMLCLALLNFTFWEKYLQEKKQSFLYLSILFLSLCVFSHELGLLLPLFLIARQAQKDQYKLDWKILALFSLPLLLFAFCRFSVIQGNQRLGVLDNALLYQDSKLDQLAMSFEFFLQYLGKLVWPQELLWTYEFQYFPLHSWGNWKSILGLVLFLSIAGSILYLWKKKPVIAFGTLFFLLGILPFLHLFAITKGSFSESYLFLSSFGFIIILVYLAQYKSYLKYVFFVMIGLYSWKTLDRIPDWKDNQKLYEADINKAENCLEAQSALAILYSEQAQKIDDQKQSMALVEKANEYFAKAINIYGNDIQTWFKFGMNHLMTGEYTMSELAFKQVIRLDKNYTSAYNNLGNIYYLRKEREQAKTQYELAVISDSKNAEALSNLGAMYLLNGQYDSAYIHLAKANQIEPNNENTSYNLNLVKKKMGY